MTIEFTPEELDCIKQIVEGDIERSAEDRLEEYDFMRVDYMRFLLIRAKVISKINKEGTGYAGHE